MALVSDADVQQIYSVDDQDLTPFINVADSLIASALANVGLTTAQLTQIELYLAAHFAVISLERGGLTRQRIGDSEDFYQTWTNNKVGFQATRFGQQAMILDTTGTIANLGTARLSAMFKTISRGGNR